MLALWGAALVAADGSAIVVHHTEMKNSSNPIQNFVARFENFGNTVLQPAVRYRINDAGDLHFLKMERESCDTSFGYDGGSDATDIPQVECVYSAAVEFDMPGKVSYTITAGEGFGHTIWTPENKIGGEFWILERSEQWIDIEPVPDSESPKVTVTARISQSAGDTSFVFADTLERVPFVASACVDEGCAKTAVVDAGQRQTVDYFVEADSGEYFWPGNETHRSFAILANGKAVPNATPHTLSGGEWAGIGVGIAIGSMALVYVAYIMIRRRGRVSGTPAETERFL